ncbi:hypothetical protein Fot_41824 [Forsythia ovata]|uniref:No apical meristem-associated C-terminal domain-containing protein n=1 Tax=Forsythia ovata TaxID=205694 RepID=A0ABD1RJG0_9LAMI
MAIMSQYMPLDSHQNQVVHHQETEPLRQSSSSLNRAKTLLAQEDKFKKGFKFDHVWFLLKDTEKFGHDNCRELPDYQRQSVNFASSQSESPTSESPSSASPGLSSFSLQIDEENVGGTSTGLPIGIKKSERKKEN